MRPLGRARPRVFFLRVALASAAFTGACGSPDPQEDAPAAAVEPGAADDEGWTPIFNGRDLTGWTPKITGSELGEDPLGTFRVEDGLLTVGYERYDEFGGRFGHLFYEEPLSRYELRVEYRFVGEQVKGGPEWAFKNSGVMFHAQSPASMMRDQDFPISIEAQFLGGDGQGERPTANLCTPATHVVMDGALVERHCTNADAPTFHGEEWVTVDLLVDGDSLVVHKVNGQTVMTYGGLVVGGGDVAEFGEEAADDGAALGEGYIALQSESHPIQFRQVLLRRLPAG